PAERVRPVARKHHSSGSAHRAVSARRAASPRGSGSTHRAGAPRRHGAHSRGESRRAAVQHAPAAVPQDRPLRAAVQEPLKNVIARGPAPLLAAKALRLVYTNLVAATLFDLSLDALHRLRALDPADTTGAANLWNRGWEEYSRRDYAAALGHWNELDSLYRGDPVARRGRYWSARAFEAMGERGRAQEIYRQLADADTDDFYRRNALAHLGGKLAPAALAPLPSAASIVPPVASPAAGA